MADWYRNKSWNQAIEANFYEKLNKARSQREQYIVIQALTLVEKHPNTTLQLIEKYFETRKNKFDDVRALLAKAEAYLTLDNTTKAIKSYKEILEREKEFPNHRTNTYIEYPYIVAIKGIEVEYANALKLLNEKFDNLTFPLDFFKWHAAKAIINKDKIEAYKALNVAKIKKSSFPFHQNLGLVGKEYKSTVKQLVKI